MDLACVLAARKAGGALGQRFVRADDQEPAGGQALADPGQDLALQGRLEVREREIAAKHQLECAWG